MPTAPSLPDATRLSELEAKIERSIDQWRTVAQSLAEIRDTRLYRFSDKTFDTYLQRRWGLTATSAYRLIRSEAAAANLANVATLSEPQARALSKVPTDRQADALAAAGGAGARLADLERTANAHRPPRRRRAGRAKPKPIILRGSGWRITIERRTAALDPLSLLSAAADQIHQTKAA